MSLPEFLDFNCEHSYDCWYRYLFWSWLVVIYWLCAQFCEPHLPPSCPCALLLVVMSSVEGKSVAWWSTTTLSSDFDIYAKIARQDRQDHSRILRITAGSPRDLQDRLGSTRISRIDWNPEIDLRLHLHQNPSSTPGSSSESSESSESSGSH